VNQASQEKPVHLVNVAHQEKKVIEVILVNKGILVMLVQLVHLVVTVLMVYQVTKEKKENQLVFQQYKECPEKKEHQVFPV